MARIFITGSSDGIGLAAARLLTENGHKVYLHARNSDRAAQAKESCPKAEGVLIGDLTSIASTKQLASEANKHGPWDSVIHNAGVGPSAPENRTKDDMAMTFQVNTLAPYILTSLMEKPKRLLYLSSSLHSGGEDSLKDLPWRERRYSAFRAFQAYGDSKLHDVMLANAVARFWSEVQSCSMDPGWINTKMGGSGAPGKTSTPAKAIADFAVGQSSITGEKTGVYFNPSGARSPHKGAVNEGKQESLLKICEQLSGGVPFPK